MTALTKKELKWLTDLQEHLNACPSKRLGFYTIGDPAIVVYDMSKDREIEEIMDSPLNNSDFHRAVSQTGAELSCIYFPSPVQSTAG